MRPAALKIGALRVDRRRDSEPVDLKEPLQLHAWLAVFLMRTRILRF